MYIHMYIYIYKPSMPFLSFLDNVGPRHPSNLQLAAANLSASVGPNSW